MIFTLEVTLYRTIGTEKILSMHPWVLIVDIACSAATVSAKPLKQLDTAMICWAIDLFIQDMSPTGERKDDDCEEQIH